jgi:HTH-type transcriptional regulator / antitoxin HigA
MKTELSLIRSDADHRLALRQVERLWGAKTGTPDGNRLEVLAVLIEHYETERWSIDNPDPIDAILFRMDQQGLTRAELEPLIGSRARVAEVLGRVRPLSIRMIRNIREKLDIPADILIAPGKRRAGAGNQRRAVPKTATKTRKAA